MGMIFPENISERISGFLDGKLDFPFINGDELMCVFFLYGRKLKVNGEDEYKQVIDLARQTYQKISMDIKAHSAITEIDRITELVRSNYVNRGLQITVETRGKEVNVDQRFFSDPMILSDCFARHIVTPVIRIYLLNTIGSCLETSNSRFTYTQTAITLYSII
jgi:hypothetical protein